MTERAKKLLLLYYKQSRKIRRVSGLPPLTFKAKKAGTLKNYRIYGNTETLTRIYSGSAPLSFPITDGNVSNYRIYGNTVNGESVGDRTGNILPMSTTPIDTIIDDFHCEYDGMGTIKLIALTNNAILSGFTVPLSKDFTIPISVGRGGTGCLQINNDAAYINVSDKASFILNLKENTYTQDYWRLLEINRINSNYTGMGGANINAVQIQTDPDAATNIKSGQTLTIRPAFVENVTERVPFEPYGYKIPVTNNSETANIYLDELLTKSGDNADYIDYAEQKRYNADGTSEDVTLPALPAQSSTNSLSVGTAVQTSSVAVDVSEVVSCGDKVTDSQSVNYGKYKIPVILTAGSAETTDIYLDTPLAKSGNNADYIDYATQKRHNSDGTESSVTLPEISTLAGTNTLTVGTEVQPSSVEIKGRIKAAGGD